MQEPSAQQCRNRRLSLPLTRLSERLFKCNRLIRRKAHTRHYLSQGACGGTAYVRRQPRPKRLESCTRQETRRPSPSSWRPTEKKFVPRKGSWILKGTDRAHMIAPCFYLRPQRQEMIVRKNVYVASPLGSEIPWITSTVIERAIQ
jgi:hypothetical protein